jgi:hypothetical protein
MRPVIDLFILNTYLVVLHFKMETNRSIRASILSGIWSTSLEYRSPDGPVGLHFEMEDHKVSIQNKKVYDWSHSPLFLGDQEETGIKSWTQGRSSIRASINPGIWSTSLDLTDAYFHCPISVAFRKYLRFVWDNKVFQFRALPSFVWV